MIIHRCFSTLIGVNGIDDQYFTNPMFKPFISFSSLPWTLDLLGNLQGWDISDGRLKDACLIRVLDVSSETGFDTSET